MIYAMVAFAALGLGWASGRLYERAARGWSDYRTAKAQLPLLLAAARALTLRAAGLVLLTALVAMSALYLLATAR